MKTVIAHAMSLGSGICNSGLIFLTVLDLGKHNVVQRNLWEVGLVSIVSATSDVSSNLLCDKDLTYPIQEHLVPEG